MAHKIDELPVFSKAQEFSVAVTAILARSKVRRDCDTYKQIVEANESILSNMDEGFEQGSDDGFAKYLKRSNFKDRGRFRAAQRLPEKEPEIQD